MHPVYTLSSMGDEVSKLIANEVVETTEFAATNMWDAWTSQYNT